jgi:hypothetical protein
MKELIELVDLEDLGFDVTFQRHDIHPHRYTCTVRRWDKNKEKFKQGTFMWQHGRQSPVDLVFFPDKWFIYPSDRLKRYFQENFFNIEKITGLKINWKKYDSLPIFDK